MKLTRKLRGPSFEKTAGKFALGDNPETYASELLAHLYKQHSYLGKYKVNLSIEGQDDSMGYLYGVFLISQATEVPPVEQERKMGEMTRAGEEPSSEEKKNSLRVPIIVENKKVYSYDVMITPDGKFLPLNEQRIAAALFNPSPYAVAPTAVAKSTPGAASNMNPNEPSGVTGSTMGAGSLSDSYSMPKSASILAKVGSLVNPKDIEDFLEKVTTDERLMDATQINEEFSKVVVKLAHIANNTNTIKRNSTEDFTGFDSAVVTKVSGGYKLKFASADYKVDSVVVPNSQSDSLSLDVRQDAIDHGYALLVQNNNEPLVEVEKTANLKTIYDTGVYSVISKVGTAQRAVVVDKVTSLDGRDLDLCLVVGKAGASLQEKVAGVRCGDVSLSSINGVEPHGDGVFLLKEAGVVTEPVSITNTVNNQGEIGYLYDHPLFGTGILKKASVNKAVKVKHNEYLIPLDSAFVPLTFGAGYMTDVTSIDKIASRHDRINKVTLLSDGSEYTFTGTPVAHMSGVTLDKTASLLMLGVLGDTPNSAYRKLAGAEKGASVEFVSKRKIASPTLEVPIDGDKQKIAKLIRIDLIKEAASLVGSDTVDSVLSLNFVSPENIQGYIDSVPDLEVAASRLAELLIGVRLGLTDIPESAVGSALKGIERALLGLKKLQIRSNAVV